jgi:chromosomal replication initiation ATPase DnaA
LSPISFPWPPACRRPRSAHARRATHAAVRARQLAIYLTHITFHWSLARVAFAFGRDRTTCGHACRKIEDMRENAVFDRRLSDLEACLRQAPAHAEEIPA